MQAIRPIPRIPRTPYNIPMAKCDEGYLCDICDQPVEAITESELYLRYVLGEIAPEKLTLERERHIHCNPTIAQFILDPEFPVITCEGAFAKNLLDPAFVHQEEARVTRGWKRLQQVPTLGVAVTEYPLEEVRQAWSASS